MTDHIAHLQGVERYYHMGDTSMIICIHMDGLTCIHQTSCLMAPNTPMIMIMVIIMLPIITVAVAMVMPMSIVWRIRRSRSRFYRHLNTPTPCTIVIAILKPKVPCITRLRGQYHHQDSKHYTGKDTT